MLPKILVVMTAIGALASPALAASEQFGMSYHVERVDSARLSVEECLATTQRASTGLGYVTAKRQLHPGQLGVYASGPRNGGGSLTVYCIAVDRKTAFVVQALDYNRPNSAAAQRAADTIRQALLRAGAQ